MAGKQNFSLNKAKKKVFVESLDQFRHLEVSSHQVFSILLGFARFFCSYVVLSKRLEFKEFNKAIIIPFMLVGYETGYSQLISNKREWNNNYCQLLNSQPRIMQFSCSDWFTQSRLSAHIP